MTVYKVGDFALLQGQVIEIIEIEQRYLGEINRRICVKLISDSLRHWIHEGELKPMSQEAPKVLFSKP